MAAKSLAVQLAEAQARVVTLQAKIEAAATAPKIEVGAEVKFLFGRGENRKNYVGKVLAVSEDGSKVRVQYGEGFDINIATVTRGEIGQPDATPRAVTPQEAALTPQVADQPVTVVTPVVEAQQAAVAEAQADPLSALGL